MHHEECQDVGQHRRPNPKWHPEVLNRAGDHAGVFAFDLVADGRA
jgi:hypothetical protein